MSKAERTRQFIIEKTAPIFNTKGYAGTSMSDITDATGLTKGSIYGNFENKDEVALAAFDFNLAQVQKILNTEVEKQTTLTDKLLVYVQVYDNFLKYPFPVGGCPILNTAIEADDTHPLLKNKAAEAITDWKSKLAQLISKGVQNKEFRADVNPEQTALTIIAMIEGAIMITKLTGKTNFRKAILQSVEKLIQGLA
ncbi:TetR/AcrR family transcriptional regulator [Adhaeribacter radiodurans]|uniref:TetR/AcrR family transcriptional regulator n=1 Tax=Adhaeribacter radiodurans TaxID=2745197 RepID=A0A7L7LET4_9BACT|nr:TetR/AcrR family transcriptional regulator [Adhaeribacter radiodurans]QMU30899.1 TetR/AcrR family transcriptional regulator [Adhaeribacter radiodurans]